MLEAVKRHEEVSRLFQEAAELPPPERGAFLERECGQDTALRREIEAMLQADAQSDGFIDQPVSSIPLDLLTEDDFTGRAFGAYRVIREIGRGGLGAVYLAARADEQFQKQVAIKVVKRGLDTDDILRRFRSERQILAQLDHPNIARLLDAGSTDDGLPYFVMEYVEGDSISKYCDAHKLSTRERLELFGVVCGAVAYAHRHLVIHRDIKPSNIIVSADGTPKLLDFGIAKVLHADEPSAAATMTGVRVMTPEYASPEQVRGLPITTSTDVYSLGVLLFELLTGQKPYRLTTQTPEELSRAVLEQTPERPSTARRSTQSASDSDQKSLRGDLDNVVLMALRKEPERRYSSVLQFAEDIRRHLEGRPVLAHKDTFTYRAGKFVRRNRLGVTTAAFILLTLIGGIVATAWQAKRATAERDRAQREGAKAAGINAFLQNILGFSDPTWFASKPRGDAHQRTISEAIDEAARRADKELGNEPEVLAAVHFAIGRIFSTQGKPDRSEVHLRASLDIRRKVLGSEHPETMQSKIVLGEQLAIAGKLAEAEVLLREGVDFYRRAGSKSATDLKWFVAALSGLANTQTYKGDAVAGDALLRESLDAAEGLTGPDRLGIPTILNNLSVSRSEQGDIDGAIGYLRRALEEHRVSQVDLRLHKATALSNLGLQLMFKGEYAEAEPLLRESIEMFRATVGEEYQLASRPFIFLATVLYLRGDYQAAKEQIEHIIGVQQRTLGEAHIDLARSWLVLGRILTRTGDAATGEAYLRKALDMRTKAFPQGHWRIAEVHSALADCLMEQGRHAEAEPLLTGSHTVFEKKFGVRDPRTQEIRRLTVRLYDDWGRPESAIPYR